MVKEQLLEPKNLNGTQELEGVEAGNWHFYKPFSNSFKLKKKKKSKRTDHMEFFKK